MSHPDPENFSTRNRRRQTSSCLYFFLRLLKSCRAWQTSQGRNPSLPPASRLHCSVVRYSCTFCRERSFPSESPSRESESLSGKPGHTAGTYHKPSGQEEGIATDSSPGSEKKKQPRSRRQGLIRGCTTCSARVQELPWKAYWSRITACCHWPFPDQNFESFHTHTCGSS